MTLCPSLASFRFSPDANLDLDILNPVDDVAPIIRPPAPAAQPNAHLGSDDGNNDPFGGGEDMNHDFGGGDEDYSGAGQATGDGSDDFFEGLGGEPSGSGSGAYGDQTGEFGPGNQSEVTVEMGHAGHLFDEIGRAHV